MIDGAVTAGSVGLASRCARGSSGSRRVSGRGLRGFYDLAGSISGTYRRY
jgi:hypothetical protein